MQIVGASVRALDPAGVPIEFSLPRPGEPFRFVRQGRAYTYTQPSGESADATPFCRGIHARERTWGNFLRAVVGRARRRGKLTYLLLGTALQVVFRTEITRTRCRFEVAAEQ